LGISVVRNVTLEEKMASSLRNQQLAFQAAEEALRYCETRILVGDGATLNPPLIEQDPAPQNGPYYWDDQANWTSTTFSIKAPFGAPEAGLTDPLSANRPKCMVENMGILPNEYPNGPYADKPYYRVTAKGWGGNANVAVMLQSYLTLVSF
jgi:type IV pilus assembly protein PilX